MVRAVFTSMSVSVQGFAVKIITQPENETILIIKICADFESENDRGTNLIYRFDF